MAHLAEHRPDQRAESWTEEAALGTERWGQAWGPWPRGCSLSRSYEVKGEGRGSPQKAWCRLDSPCGWALRMRGRGWGGRRADHTGLPCSLWLRLCLSSEQWQALEWLEQAFSFLYSSIWKWQGGRPLCAFVTGLPNPPPSFPPGNSALNGLGNLPSPPQSGGLSGPVPTQFQRDPVLHCLEPVTREPLGDHGDRLDGGHKTQSTQRRQEEILALASRM